MERDSDGFVTLYRGRQPILWLVIQLLVMAVSIALFARVMDAKGQTAPGFEPRNNITTTTGAMCFYGGAWFPSRNGVCYSEDAVRGVCLTHEACKLPLTQGSIIGENVTVTNSYLTCESGYSLVSLSGCPMCARDMREPK